jgi:hypothetical protein
MLDTVAWRNLKIEPAYRRRPQALHRETVAMVSVDQLPFVRGGVCQYAEPCERVVMLEGLQYPVGDRRPTNTVEAVASGDEIAAQLLLNVVRVAEADARLVTVEIHHSHVGDLEVDPVTGYVACGEQVLDHLLLRIQNRRAPARQLRHWDAGSRTIEAHLEPFMEIAFAAQPVVDACLLKYLDSGMFEQSGADTVLDELPAALFENPILDAGQMQEPT